MSNEYISSYNVSFGFFNDKVEKYNKIPKILFTYWDGSRISFLHYLTIYTLHKHHKDWKIILYIPKLYQKNKSWLSFENKEEYKNIDYFDNILNLNIDIRLIDMSEIIDHNISEIIKSDYFRLLALKYHGGIWFDMDMLFINNIKLDLVLNTNNGKIENEILKDKDYIIDEEDIKDNNFFQVIAKDHYCQYFLLSDKNTDYINYILEHVKIHLDIKSYQSIGTDMLNIILPSFLMTKNKLKSYLIDHNVVAPFKHYEMDILFNQNKINMKNFLMNSYAIHWFNGSVETKNFINNFTHLTNLKDCTLKNIINELNIFNEEEKEFLKNLKKISIVINYTNKKDQLLIDLNEIKKSQYKNTEVIIVNDCLDNDIHEKKYTVIKDKRWINILKNTTGDIIILQNEICNIEDYISYIVKNLRLNQLIKLNCNIIAIHKKDLINCFKNNENFNDDMDRFIYNKIEILNINI
jgi:hypothetical protein